MLLNLILNRTDLEKKVLTMTVKCSRPFSFVVALLLCPLQAAVAKEPSVTLEKLRQALRQREAALKSFSVKVETNGQLFAPERSRIHAKEGWTIDNDPGTQEKPGCRVRHERLYRRTGADGKTKETVALAWNRGSF